MHELLEESRPTVGINDLIAHVNDYVRRFGSAESTIPFWTGTITTPDDENAEEFVSIRLVSNQNLSLIHTDFHAPGPTNLITTLSNGNLIRVPIEILSCASFRLNWHRSHATFRRANLGLLKWKSAESTRLIRDARRAHADSRKSQRASYHCPAVIDPVRRPVTAYVRDISEKGMGFLHAQPVEVGPIAVDVYPGHEDEPIRVHVHITWCARSIDVGYRSGGYFVNMTD
jgi:hypothetical protein